MKKIVENPKMKVLLYGASALMFALFIYSFDFTNAIQANPATAVFFILALMAFFMGFIHETNEANLS